MLPFYGLPLDMLHTVFFKNLALTHPPNPPIHGFTNGVAYLSASCWWYSGVNFGGGHYPVPIDPQDVASLKAWIKGIFGDTDPLESNYRPGTAYKRITLPLNTGGSSHKTIDEKAMTQSFVALKLLLTKMQDIFETVEPGQANLQTYGHKIRELLLLAAMEVEASWAAVLKANGYAGSRFSTKDYVKLLAPMALDSFSLKLRSYPEFPATAPFRGWKVQSPTGSLDWYDAYNHTKHNREEHLGVATLERAVKAVSAAAVMFYAQFGYSFQHDDEKRSLIRNTFTLNIDHSMYPTACYIPNAGGGADPWDWELLDYPFPPR
jgi:hypothetical protein